MARIVTMAAVVAVSFATTAAISNAAAPGAITLKGSVGPGYTIGLTRNGKRVTTLRAGTYRFVIADRATVHNFVLEKERGGRFERELTDVSDTGTKTVVIKLTPGTWKYYCEPHESMMSGTFTVT
ncbi:MAG TPA: plastocyanin/azurin family copper-binding protein [Gaiellaceae bacterium]|nr:plastocyanin/azurin family copper-binding protein [Gaiellaceae bacterium]